MHDVLQQTEDQTKEYKRKQNNKSHSRLVSKVHHINSQKPQMFNFYIVLIFGFSRTENISYLMLPTKCNILLSSSAFTLQF
jgi:hypothetical protein